MSDLQIRQLVLSTENLDESIDFYQGLGFTLKYRDGAH
jgi:catechol 2,3-dioxygenase-like lactoylglutathione lyase family enzyme